MTDSGTGTPYEVMRRIFEPFFSTHPKGQGTGLRLSTVQRAVRGHGDAVPLTRCVGVGTEFKGLLPALDERPTARPPPPPAA